jgi:type II secretory ATPase GspE/PulE/Tfp pilus assembly ATPase PilB-like protein
MNLPDDQLSALLSENKIVDEAAISELAAKAKEQKTSIYQILLKKDPHYESEIVEAWAKKNNVPFIALTKLFIPEEVLTLVPERLAREKKIISFGRDKEFVHLAMADPEQKGILQFLERKTGQKIKVYVATSADVESTIKTYKGNLQETIDELIKEGGKIKAKYLGEAPITKIVDTLIASAYQDRASDIHIEPEEESSLIRFRVDGVLHDLFRMPKGLHDRVVTRIKVVSNLRTDEHLAAQDGKMRIELPEENLDIRVSILPVVEGEKVVLRLLSSKSRDFNLANLGMSERDLKITTAAFSKSFGAVLSTGPTGAGKTTTIYAILKLLNQREKNLTTIEDPVEYRIMGANQVQVNVKTNLTFANGLRSILRQDPNIIFVGEIRDGETADIAVNAALTGHLVFSTLHTNDAATAIPRLTDMGVEPFLVASTVNVIIAQRLIRKICTHCRYSLTITEAEMAKKLSPEIVKKTYIPVGPNKEIRIYQGKGCKDCRQSGYLGRVGIYEVLEVTKKIRELIAQKSGSDKIVEAAIAEGMTTMLDDGLSKVAKGITTMEEVLRVTKTEFL